MSTNRRTLVFVRTPLLLALALTFGSSQSLSQKSGSPRRQPSSGDSTREADSRRVRQSRALTLLIETADHARLFDDQFYRAKVQALAADALWSNDSTRARTIFRRAWIAATASDKAEQEESERESGSMTGINTDFSEARHEVLKIVAARDTKLAELFLRELAGDKPESNATDNAPSRARPNAQLTARRLALAGELLAAGETRRAAEVAAPIISDGPSTDLMVYIQRLRQQDVNEADALYLRLLRRAAADPNTNANEVLLLSSHIISPTLIVVIDFSGMLEFRSFPRPRSGSSSEQSVPQRTQSEFFSLAASVLLRPRGPRASLTMQDLMAEFYATGRLLPYFEKSSTPIAAYAPALRARHSELYNEIESSRREQVSAQFTLDSLTPAGFADPLRSETEQLSRATNAAERKRLASLIIQSAVRNRFWDRARRAASELEDSEDRRAALSFIQVQQIKDISNVYADEKEDDFESVVKFVSNADVPAVAKAWGFSQAAIVASRRKDVQKSQKIAELITEAEHQASRVSQGTSTRVAAYGIVTTSAARVAPARAWELLRQYVEAANALDDFAGDVLEFEMVTDDSLNSDPMSHYGVEPEVFRCDTVFATMADLSFEKALEEVRGLNGEVPQAFASIAIARTALEKQSAKPDQIKSP
ncbi:MAG: hypothetical protein QOJ64_4377 [Acidobacteriota bacterium]|nr:hypothetical protein [Acidobacteriota bacterium]